MGAAGIQMGTFFVLTEECGVHPRFKEAFIKAQARDAVATPQIGSELKVVAVRALRNKGLDGFLEMQVDLIQKRKKKEISHEEAQHGVESFWVGALRRAAKDGDIDTGSLMAGQSVGLVDRVRPLREALSFSRRGGRSGARPRPGTARGALSSVLFSPIRLPGPVPVW